MSRLAATSFALQRPRPALRRRLALAAVAGNVVLGVACGEDVLVARFGLTSNAPDAGAIEAAAGDAGSKSKRNEQSTAAQRARAKARRLERANDHLPSRPSADEDDH